MKPLLHTDFPTAPWVDSMPLLGDADALRARGHELGYLYFRGLLAQDLLTPLRRWLRGYCVEQGWALPDEQDPPVIRANPEGVITGQGWDDPRFVELQRQVRLRRDFATMASDSRLVEVLTALMGEPPTLATANHLWVKLPGSPAQTTRPHQDIFYLPDCPRMWTVWIPVSDTPMEVGPLGVAPGSHTRGIWEPVTAMGGIEVPSDLLWHTGEVHPGDLVMFEAAAIHCAWSNVSPSLMRASFDIRYEPRSVGAASILKPAPHEGFTTLS